MNHYIITGFATKDGHPIYLLANNAWTEQFSEALTIPGKEQGEKLLEQAQSNALHVCDPYLIEVHIGENGPEPTSLRERIRANGPTVQYKSSPA